MLPPHAFLPDYEQVQVRRYDPFTREVMLYELLCRPAFLVTGEVSKWRGSDGEPCVIDPFPLAALDLADTKRLIFRLSALPFVFSYPQEPRF